MFNNYQQPHRRDQAHRMKSPPWQNLTQSTQGTRDNFVSIISFNTCMQQMYHSWSHRTSSLCFSPTLLFFWFFGDVSWCTMCPMNRIPSAPQRPGRRIEKEGDLNRETVQNPWHSAFLCNSVNWILSKLPMPSGYSGWRGLSLHSAPAPSLTWGRGSSPHSQTRPAHPQGLQKEWFHFLMFSYASST